MILSCFAARGSFLQSFLIAAAGVPSVARFMFPSGTVESQLLEWQEISGLLRRITNDIGHNLNQSLPVIQNNVTNFATITSSGAFSQWLPSADDLKSQILSGLNTYLISQAYQASQFREAYFLFRVFHHRNLDISTSLFDVTIRRLCSGWLRLGSASAQLRLRLAQHVTRNG